MVKQNCSKQTTRNCKRQALNTIKVLCSQKYNQGVNNCNCPPPPPPPQTIVFFSRQKQRTVNLFLVTKLVKIQWRLCIFVLFKQGASIIKKMNLHANNLPPFILVKNFFPFLPPRITFTILSRLLRT